MIHEAGSIIISILDGEAKPGRGHTHTHLDMSPGSPVPESMLLIPTLEWPHSSKVKMKIQGTERKTNSDEYYTERSNLQENKQADVIT